MIWLVTFCSLLGAACLFLGIYLGGLWEQHAAARDAREDRAGAEADEYLEQLGRREAMARRIHPVYRQLPPPEVAHEDAGPRLADLMEARRLASLTDEELMAEAIAHRAWEAHTGQALALANVARELSPSDQPLDSLPGHPDPTVSAWTQQMAANMDRWLAEHVYGVPYSADEL